MVLVYISLGLLIAFLIQAQIYTVTWRRNLRVEIQFEEEAVVEGDDVIIIESVSNLKNTSVVSLKTNLNIDRHIQFVNQENTVLSDRSCHSEVFAMEPHSSITRRLKCHCMKRGYYCINEVFLVSNDLFYTQILTDRVAQNASLYVYPEIADLDEFKIISEKILGDFFSRVRNQEDPFAFRGVRGYEPFDPIRNINWKLSARAGELMVNQYENTAQQEIKILLDVGCDMLIRQDALVEEAIRIVASLAEQFIEKEVITSVASNGADIISGIPFSINGGAGINHMIHIKRGLSRIKNDFSETVMTIEQILDTEIGNLQQRERKISYVLVSTEARPEIVRKWNTICDMGCMGWWIMPVYKKDEMFLEEWPTSDFLYWRVPYGK